MSCERRLRDTARCKTCGLEVLSPSCKLRWYVGGTEEIDNRARLIAPTLRELGLRFRNCVDPI